MPKNNTMATTTKIPKAIAMSVPLMELMGARIPDSFPFGCPASYTKWATMPATITATKRVLRIVCLSTGMAIENRFELACA